jgi:hypothetical protein
MIGGEDDLRPEKVWVCVHCGEHCGVGEEECEHCSHWEALPNPTNLMTFAQMMDISRQGEAAGG